MSHQLIHKVCKITDSIYFIPNNIEIKVNGLAEKIANGEFTAYICQNNICIEPITSLDNLIEYLKK